MAGTASWIGGNANGLNWASAGFTATDFNSLAAASQAVSAAYDNSISLDIYADVSFSLVVGGTTTASSYIAVYLLPLNQDTTTYGDGAASLGSTLPAGQYLAGEVGVRSGIASGSAVTGTISLVRPLPPGKFVLTLANQLGVALSATAAAAVQIRTYNENLNR